MDGVGLSGTVKSASLPPVTESQRLIEVSFPFMQISRLAKVEAYRKNIYRPAYYLHKWWARRTGSVFRAIALGCLLKPTEDLMERFYLPNPTLGNGKIVLDPFMGGGTTVGETLRLGAKVIGVDINPVAWFLVKKVVEPVALSELDQAFRKLESSVARRMLDLYCTPCPKCKGRAVASYVYWVKIVKCRLCGAEVPLRKSMIIAKHMSQPDTGLVSCPSCGELFIAGRLSKDVGCNSCGAQFDPTLGYSDGEKYTCASCGCRDDVVRAYRAQELPPEHRLIGLAYVCETCGKGYKKPSAEDYAAFERIREEFRLLGDGLTFPRGSIPPGYNTDQMRNYNYHYWHQMFNERQLLSLSWLLEAILKLEPQNVREFMLLLFSGLLEFNNVFCSPKGLGTGAVRHLFAHHAYIPPKEVIEANVWGAGRSSGGFSTLYTERLRAGKEWAVNPVEHRMTPRGMTKVPTPGEQVASPLAGSFEELTCSPDKNVWLLNRSSTSLSEIPSGRVGLVITDPPYFDNVMYSELADFFYVWLQLALKERYPAFNGQSVNKSEEAIKNLGGDSEATTYRDVLQKVLAECERVLNESGLLVFTFHHSAPEAWDSLGEALGKAGFQVERFYPVYSEMDVGVPILGKETVKFDAILVCKRKRDYCGVELEDEREVLEQVIHDSLPVISELHKEFGVSQTDARSIACASWLVLCTQGRTRLKAASLNWEKVGV